MLVREMNDNTKRTFSERGLISNRLECMEILILDLDIYSSQLKDSFYCLPTRPDLAFYFLWMSVNRAYRDFYLKDSVLGTESIMGKKMVESISGHLIERISLNNTIESLMKSYLNNFGEQIFKFLGNIILKGLSIEKYCNANGLVSRNYINSQYKTLKSRFKDVIEAVKETYLSSYYNDLSDIKFENNVILLQSSEENTQKVRSLSLKLKKLSMKEEVTFSNNQVNYSKKIRLSDQEFVMMYYQILNSIRNSNIHGNGNSRLSTPNAKKKNIKNSEAIYLATYFYFGLEMYLLGKIHLDDLVLFEKNIKLLVN